ncbi:pyridoxamine 5'-phosphate oxidase family protein [Pseudalkalibacillus caeni]|uniref:Pyridoxamine 5'-phosphate oxidase N-terminal domain-containing protein n=1 Tax=Exobacillus caeni TaxID=2574798 RepID=A0A5R9F5S2_9BACL|nr:pyridoxamine 5'-phosphate oxidase family protein [Pseudalkalibacillus caeni]TLS37676.1 hypothetical protein FCL54_07575 [Pseudalkalibacillus caeni]
MPNKINPILTAELWTLLQKEQYVTLCTIDNETYGPYVSAISWLYAPDETTILFAVDNRSRIIKNIKENPLVSFTLIANESTYSINGSASIAMEKIEGVPLKLALINVKVNEVRDVMFYGARMSVEPAYEKVYDLEAAAKLDLAVMEAMKRSLV